MMGKGDRILCDQLLCGWAGFAQGPGGGLADAVHQIGHVIEDG